MKLTGSVMQTADDVFVPAYRVFPLTAAVEGDYLGGNDELTYQTIFVPSLFMKLIGPHLGMGLAAFDYVIAKAETKAIAYTGYAKQADSAVFQSAIAKALVQLEAAELVAREVADRIYRGAERDYYAPYGERIEMRAKAGWVVETITSMINDLMTAHGSAGFAESATLQRVWRDQATASRHGHTWPPVASRRTARSSSVARRTPSSSSPSSEKRDRRAEMDRDAIEARLTAADFIHAFRYHPAGVAIVTADDGSGPVAMTVSSVSSVSIDPPTLVFSASSKSSSTPTIRNADTVVVHMLASDQVTLAKLGARSRSDRFGCDVEWGRLPTGEPYYPHANAWIRGRVTQQVDVNG